MNVFCISSKMPLESHCVSSKCSNHVFNTLCVCKEGFGEFEFICQGQRTTFKSQFSTSIMVPRVEFRLSGLCEKPSLSAEPSH